MARFALTTITAVSLAAVAAPAAIAGDTRPDGGRSAENVALENEMTPELDATVTRGLEWLARNQNPDGSWTGGSRYGRHVGITALACIAFMADGHIPGRGGYGDNVARGLDFVLNNMTETGLLARETSHGPMYGHGFAALFLGEIYGMTGGGPDKAQASRLYDALLRSIRLIVQTQNNEGGWRYNPVPYDADISVTICQIMALRSARNAGVDVPIGTIDRAVEYVRQCQNPDGGFKYQLTSGGSAWPRSAAGVASLYYAGIYEDDAIERGLDYIIQTGMPGRMMRQSAHYYYGHYYAVQSMYLAGGERWEQWWPAIRSELISLQREDGAWDDPHAGQAYGTSMALIILQMPKRYLPIFQK
ncbi:MAG: prenyltransferase [Phycisphaeraceae bacterium]|nr:MAG: prenyltransferase [Phycisphaeraceae bacterium]